MHGHIRGLRTGQGLKTHHKPRQRTAVSVVLQVLRWWLLLHHLGRLLPPPTQSRHTRSQTWNALRFQLDEHQYELPFDGPFGSLDRSWRDPGHPHEERETEKRTEAMNFGPPAIGFSPTPQLPPVQQHAFGIVPHHAVAQFQNGPFVQPRMPSVQPQAPPAIQDQMQSPDLSGVGIFFQVPENEVGAAYVQHIVPRSSADRCGMIQLGDELLAAGEAGQTPTNIERKGLPVLREKILGKQGSFVVLHFRRKYNGDMYEIELMRGSPEYIDMMNISSGLKERQQNDMMRIQELEGQVAKLQQQLQTATSQVQTVEDPRIGPLEDELRARMDDLRRFEDMLVRAKQRTSEALRARDEAVEQLEMLKRTHTVESKIRAQDSNELAKMEKTVLQLQQENNALREDALNVGNARDMLKRERDMLEERLRDYKAEMEAQQKHLEDQLRAASVVDSQLLQAEVDHLKEQLRKKEERDQDISRRLRNGHNQIAQALREQQQAAAMALEALPSVDVVHHSMMSTLRADILSMQPIDFLKVPSEPQMQAGFFSNLSRGGGSVVASPKSSVSGRREIA